MSIVPVVGSGKMFQSSSGLCAVCTGGGGAAATGAGAGGGGGGGGVEHAHKAAANVASAAIRNVGIGLRIGSVGFKVDKMIFAPPRPKRKRSDQESARNIAPEIRRTSARGAKRVVCAIIVLITPFILTALPRLADSIAWRTTVGASM